MPTVEAVAPAQKLSWLTPEMQALVPILSDSQVVSATLFGECRSEPIEGQVAVACVIRNRVQTDLHGDGKPDWWGEGYRGVCLAKAQFSCWTPAGGEGNYAKLLALVQQFAAKQPITDGAAKQCIGVAEIVMQGYALDNTKGANHYHAAKMIPRPSWAANVAPVKQVLGHIFYRL